MFCPWLRQRITIQDEEIKPPPRKNTEFNIIKLERYPFFYTEVGELGKVSVTPEESFLWGNSQCNSCGLRGRQSPRASIPHLSPTGKVTGIGTDASSALCHCSKREVTHLAPRGGMLLLGCSCIAIRAVTAACVGISKLTAI